MTPERRGAIIAVLGRTGVGKSTFSGKLAVLPATVFLETTAGNPFMGDAHTSSGRIFESQLWFLLQSVDHWTQAEKVVSTGKIAVLDTFVPWVNFHSKLGLDEASHTHYERLSERLTAHLASPNLIIYLVASSDFILERLRKRNMPYDKSVTTRFLEEMQFLHEEWIRQTKIPVLQIESQALESPENEAQYIEDIRKRVL